MDLYYEVLISTVFFVYDQIVLNFLSLAVILFCLKKEGSDFNLIHSVTILICNLLIVRNMVVYSYYYLVIIFNASNGIFQDNVINVSCQVFTTFTDMIEIVILLLIFSVSGLRYLYIFHWDWISKFKIKTIINIIKLVLIAIVIAIEIINYGIMGFNGMYDVICKNEPIKGKLLFNSFLSL